MHVLKSNDKYRKVCRHETRSTDCYVFDTDIVHMSIYSNSPYYKGVNLWNNLPFDTQMIPDGYIF